MKILSVILSALLMPLGVSANERLSGRTTTRVLAESQGTEVTLTIRPDDGRMQVIRDYCEVDISYPDGTSQRFPTFRPQRNDFTARIDPQGHKNVALIAQGRLQIYSKDRNEPIRILILRSDLRDTPPEVDFLMIDVAWVEGGLLCAGVFRDKAANRSSSFPYPFVSKMQIAEDGTPSNHQILWTTWHSKATPNLIPDAWTHKAGKPLANSLVSSGDALLWRCEGHWQTDDDFSKVDTLFERSIWLSTNSETGVTVAAGALGDQGLLDLMKGRESVIIKELENELISRRSISNKRRLEYLISTFPSNNRVKMDQASEQGGGGNPPSLWSRSRGIKRKLNQNRRGAPGSG